jgi:chromosome partitioning protein
MSVISIANHKGGVGKTTTTVNLGAGLALAGKRVLMIDLDPQSNATFSLGFQKQEKTIYNVLGYGEDIRKVIIETESMDIIPASIHLAGFEKNTEVGKEFMLTESLEEIKPDYDFILIDCPPSLGALTISALTASDFAIIALQPEFLALQGMGEFIKILRTVKTRMNRELELLGVVITQFDSRKVLHRDIVEHAREKYGDLVFDTPIRGNVALAEAQSMGKDVFQYNSSCMGALDYESLTFEVIRRTSELEVVS